jgi:hypothetical protein
MENLIRIEDLTLADLVVIVLYLEKEIGTYNSLSVFSETKNDLQEKLSKFRFHLANRIFLLTTP